MPGNVANAVIPTVGGNPLVFPQMLCRAFNETRGWPARENEYHDGTSHREALVSSARRTWKLTTRLSSADMVTLQSFVTTYGPAAFYFYNPKEPATGQPEGSNYDATGAGTQGRYKVRLAGDWNEQIEIARSNAALELVEVA
jgi:hypothetical protein